jgi:PAS domain S-box-containing protein
VQRDLEGLEAALAASHVAGAIRDGAGRYLRVNAAFAELLGLPPERIEGKADSQLHPADLARVSAANDGEVLVTGEPREDSETLLARTGRRPLRALRVALKDGTGPWAILVLVSPVEAIDEARAERDRLAAMAANPMAAAAPPVPGAALVAAAHAEQERVERLEALAREEADRAQVAEQRAAEAEERAAQAQARVGELEHQLASGEGRTSELDDQLTAAQQQLAGLEARATEAEQRAAQAEVRAGEAEARVAEAETRATDAEARAAALADQLEAAQAQASDAEILLMRLADEAVVAPAEPVMGAGAVPEAAPLPQGSWTEADDARLEAMLARCDVPNAAARAVLTTFGPASAVSGAAIWQREDDGALRCLGAWTAPGADVGAWESLAWHGAVREGVLAGAADGHRYAGPAPDGDPRGREAQVAGMASLAAIPAGPGAVLELVSHHGDHPGPELQDAAAGVAGKLAEVLARIADAASARTRY